MRERGRAADQSRQDHRQEVFLISVLAPKFTCRARSGRREQHVAAALRGAILDLAVTGHGAAQPLTYRIRVKKLQA